MKLKNKSALPRKCARRAIGDKIMTWGQRHERDHNLLKRCLYRPPAYRRAIRYADGKAGESIRSDREAGMILYYHPLSSYCWKVLIAFHENGTPFTPRILEDAAALAEWQALWPLGKFPVLHDPVRGATIAEASIIVEYLGRHEPGTFRPIPVDGDAAIEVRLMDRLFDNYVMGPMQALVADRLRPADARDPHGVTANVAALRSIYAVLEDRLAGRSWAAGDHLSLADCAAAPSLYYADRIVPLRAGHPVLGAYLNRLEARPSFARVLREMQPWWQNFPFADGPLAS